MLPATLKPITCGCCGKEHNAMTVRLDSRDTIACPDAGLKPGETRTFSLLNQVVIGPGVGVTELPAKPKTDADLAREVRDMEDAVNRKKEEDAKAKALADLKAEHARLVGTQAP